MAVVLCCREALLQQLTKKLVRSLGMTEGIKHRHSLKKDCKRLKRLKMTPNTQLEEQWSGLDESILPRMVQFSNGVLPCVGVSYHSDKID